jgi:hypothetical protein
MHTVPALSGVDPPMLLILKIDYGFGNVNSHVEIYVDILYTPEITCPTLGVGHPVWPVSPKIPDQCGVDFPPSWRTANMGEF